MAERSLFIGLEIDAERLLSLLSTAGPAVWPSPLQADFLLIRDRTGNDTSADVHAQLVASYAAARLDDVILVPEIDPFRSDPYLVARSLASLDILSKGRSGFALTPRPQEPLGVGYARTGTDAAYVAEFVAVVRALWNSWRPGALARDWSANRYVDRSRIVPARFEGSYFSVAGPLPVPTPISKAPRLFAEAVDAHSQVIADAEVVLGRGGDLAGSTRAIVIDDAVLGATGADIPAGATAVLASIDGTISSFAQLTAALGSLRSGAVAPADFDERRA